MDDTNENFGLIKDLPLLFFYKNIMHSGMITNLNILIITDILVGKNKTVKTDLRKNLSRGKINYEKK